LLERGQGNNVYFTVNQVRGRLTKKASKEDIGQVRWLHVDIDPKPGVPLAQEQAAILDKLRNGLKEIPPPTLITFSGGGYQAFWRLTEGQPVTEPFEWADNERTAQAAIYIASPADKKLSIHAELCAGLEAALQNVETVKGFASDVPLFYCYYYTIEDSQNESDDGTRTRLTRYNLKVICRDDSGV